jgi:hypothetical protein
MKFCLKHFSIDVIKCIEPIYLGFIKEMPIIFLIKEYYFNVNFEKTNPLIYFILNIINL